MPKATPEQLEKAVDNEVDRLHNKDYEVPPEVQEIRETAGVKSDEVDADSIAQIAADVDDVKKGLTELKEQAKEAAASGIPKDEGEEDPFKGAHLGMFMKEVRDMGSHGSPGKLLQAIEIAKTDDLLGDGVLLPAQLAKFLNPRQKTTGYLEEGQGSMGGFTVPTEPIDTLLSIPLMPPIMRTNAWEIPGSRKSITVPRIDDSSHASNVYGGVTGNWTAEGGSISVSNPTFGQCALNAKKLALLTYASNELLADNAVGLNEVLTRIFAEALGWFEDKAFIAGSGVNEPLGLTNAACIDNINTTASHFYIEDAATMLSNLLPSSYERAIWIMSPTVVPELVTMESLGNSRNMWFMDTAKDSPGPWRLFGRPIFFTEHCAALGTSTDVLLIDPTYYILLARQDIRVSVSTDARFANDETGYKVTLRSDGQPWVSATLTLADGSTTVSPVVNSHHA